MKWKKESDYAQSTTLPKVYDVRTTQKKSGTKKTYSSELSDKAYSSDSSDLMFATTNNYKSTEYTKPTNKIRIQSLQTQFLQAIGYLLCL